MARELAGLKPLLLTPELYGPWCSSMREGPRSAGDSEKLEAREIEVVKGRAQSEGSEWRGSSDVLLFQPREDALAF